MLTVEAIDTQGHEAFVCARVARCGDAWIFFSRIQKVTQSWRKHRLLIVSQISKEGAGAGGMVNDSA